MNVTLLKKDGKKEVINRVEVAVMAKAIKNGMVENTVRYTRESQFHKIGSALNDIQFNFKSKRTTKHMQYWLAEK